MANRMICALAAAATAAVIATESGIGGGGIDSILPEFRSCEYWRRMGATNRIDAVLAVSTNRREIADCRLLKSDLLFECSEIEHDEAKYAEAMEYCEDVAASFPPDSGDWRFFAARLLQLQALGSRNLYRDAFALATNALSAAVCSPASPCEAWFALFGDDIPLKISMEEAFKVNAAAALLSADAGADVDAFTNGISPFASSRLQEILHR